MNLVRGRVERDGDGATAVTLGDHRLSLAAANGALAAYAGTEVAVGLRPEHLADPPPALSRGPGSVGWSDLSSCSARSGSFSWRLDAKPVVADELLEPADESTSARRAVVTARFDAHAPVATGDEAEVAVATDRLHFFDLKTGAAIR